MKTTGLKAAVVVLVTMLMAGQAVAGWGGGGRRGGGRFGPGVEPGIQDNADEQGPWMGLGLGRGGPDAEAWQGGPGRGRGYQGGDVCPYCQGSGRRPVMQRRPMRGDWEQGLRGGRGGGFRRGADLPGRGAWNTPGRGFRGRDFGPWDRGPMMRRGPMDDNRGPGFGPGRGGRGFFFRGDAPGRDEQRRDVERPDRDTRPFARPRWDGERDERPGPRQAPGFWPGRGGRDFSRPDAPAPDEKGQDVDRPDRDERPWPGQRWGRDRNDRPGLRRGPDGPAERPEEKSPDAETPAQPDPNSPKQEQPTSSDEM